MRTALSFLLVFCFTNTVAADPAEDEKLRSILDMEWQYTMTEYPDWATWVGFPGQNGRWTDESREAIEKRKAHSREFLRQLKTVRRAKLSPAEQLNYDLAMYDTKEEIAGHKFPDELMPINQMSGPQQDIAEILAMQPATRVADVEDILARLQAVPRLIEQTMALMREGLQQGITPPKVTLRDVPGQISAQIAEDPMQSPMLQAFTRLPETIPAAQQARFSATAARLYTGAVRPALERLYDFVVNSYVPNATDDIALYARPNGKAWYAHKVRVRTTTDLTPAQIHALGQAEVKRIRGEMESIIRQVDFQGDFAAFTEFLRTDPQFFYNDAASLITGYRDIAKRADAELPKLFGTLPRLPYGVSPIPSYAEKSQTTAYYNQGSPEAGRAAIFYANTYDLKSRPKWEMEALTVHEAVPGHHLQIALAQELPDVPDFRKYSRYTAFVEGWGLYSESLGNEMGFYSDPYSKFGQLTYQMWRAVRLVVDTGMHAMGWSRQQAIDFFRENSSKADHDIAVEIDRYIVWPAQALAYKIGELKIKELREKATARLGDDFDIRDFHDELLGNGAIPLDMLEARMLRWMNVTAK